MQHDKGIRYFLGGNTGAGFYSLYDGFTDSEAGDFLWIIKGGPGCGKSSFMKRIARSAEGAGMTVERVLCSGDPESLDGIYIREARCAYVDGTAPHVQELTSCSSGIGRSTEKPMTCLRPLAWPDPPGRRRARSGRMWPGGLHPWRGAGCRRGLEAG